MADLKTCILAAADAGEMSRDAADEFVQRLDELAGDTSASGFHQSRVRAAQRLQDEVERRLRRKKRMKLKQAAAWDAINQRLSAADRPDKAALAVLDLDPKGVYVGENVSMVHSVRRGFAFSLMSDFVDRYRSKHGGLSRDMSGMDDVIGGLFGERVAGEAKALADGISAARNYLVGLHNAAGGDILERKNWGWVQRHDRATIASTAKQEWVDFVLDHLDASRMFGPDGQRMTARELVATVNAAYDNIVSGGLEEMAGRFDHNYTSPVNARIAHRELVFKDSRAWLAYQRRFGDPDVFGSIIGEIDRLARDTAIMEVLGPYPRASLQGMKDVIDASRGRAAIEATGRKGRQLAETVGKHRFLDATFDQVTGRANIPADAGWARASQSNRNLVTAARLGSAIWVSFGDIATNTLTAHMTGTPITRLLRELFQQLNPADGAHRRMAARMAYISETWVGDAVGAQRLMGEVTGAPSTARIADSTLRLSGLNAWTDGGRSAFRLELTGHMTDQAGKAFADVEPALRATMERHGVTAADWDMYRSTPIWTDPETGAEFIRPEDTWLEFDVGARLEVGERNARFEAARRIGAMIAAENEFAVIKPVARARALITGGTVPGGFWGEVIRNATLFRSFGVSFAYMHVSRMMAQRGLRSKAAYLAWIMIGMTIGGAIGEQASSVFRGKDPRDMTDEKFWASAAIRGGSLGPLGDFMYSSTSRHGNNLAEGLLGPIYGSQLGSLNKLTVGNIQEMVEKGEARNVGAEAQRLADGLIPGRSLWYARAAFDRMLADELTAWADGGDAEARFRRIERAAQRDFDQRFWWPPGQFVPERAPRAAAAVGGN